MINELFNEMNRDELFDWGVVLVGASGFPGNAECLSRANVKSFANAELERISIGDPILDLVVELATDCCETSWELRDRLEQICQAREVDLKLSIRKWRFISVLNILYDLYPDPLYGLIKLSEHWAEWGWPVDGPASMRRDTELPHGDYHSRSNYENVIQDHIEWIEMERMTLQ